VKHLHSIDLGQWPSALFITNDKRTYDSFHRKKTGAAPPVPFPPHGGGAVMSMQRGADCILLMGIGAQSNRDELAITIAHEATHAMRWILEHAGEKQPGTECEAYLVEHIVRQALAALR
jgi:hypothetical protein